MKRIVGVVGVIFFLTIAPTSAYANTITNECQNIYGQTTDCPVFVTFDNVTPFFSYAVSLIDERQYNILLAILLFIFILLLADFIAKYSRHFNLTGDRNSGMYR